MSDRRLPRGRSAVRASAAAGLAALVAGASIAGAGPTATGLAIAAGAEADTTAADTADAQAARPGGESSAGDTSVVYRREVFEYPAGERRNPFQPLDAGEPAGPRLQDLTLTGILHSPAAGSVAVLVDPSTGRRYRLRPGDRIGEARLVEVAADRAVFRVEGFGSDRRAVLRLQRDEESSP